ncbi:MAG TPA: exodeoxyribonuclease VII large subunit [Candidatus Baltobacteraceae bacterium]
MDQQVSLFDQTQPPRIEGVSRVVAYIGKLLSQNKSLQGLRVRGEVSAPTKSAAGHIYFDLKERADVLKCVIWASNAPALPAIKNGDEIVVSGEWGIYAARSTFQLFVTAIELTGIGNLYAQFEALKEKFRKEGLFEPGRKRPMPAFPVRIALVSARGKGAEDFESIVGRVAPQVAIQFVETRVQGDGAAIDIGEAIDKASRRDVDVIVLARGGGSYEDLFQFNLEPVVRAIVRAQRPVLSAIGHTGDVHLSDLVADHTCETPSSAAQYFGGIRETFLRRIERLDRRSWELVRTLKRERDQSLDFTIGALDRAARSVTGERASTLLRLERRLDAQTPIVRLTARRQRFDRLSSQLAAIARHALAPATSRLETGGDRLERLQAVALNSAAQRRAGLDVRLQAIDPEAPLERGYAIVTDATGKLVRDVDVVREGDVVRARLQRGTLDARVERKALDG